MIFVNRTTVETPTVLLSPRADEARRQIRAQLEDYGGHLEQVRLSFEESLWEESQPELRQLFHDKCAYCESLAIDDAGVDHFRPRMGAENLDASRSQPHYSWLAYDWENLLWACHACTRIRGSHEKATGKGNRFPVEKKRAQLAANLRQCRQQERALLLDPTYDRPEKHLKFLESGRCEGTTTRGQITIDIIGLNRAELVSKRASAWAYMQEAVGRLIDALELPNSSAAATARHEIIERLAGAKPHAAVSRTVFRIVLGHFGIESSSPIALAMSELLAKYTTTPPELLLDEVPTARVFETEKNVIGHPQSIAPSSLYYRDERPKFADDQIRRIEIRNFKAIEELNLDIPNEQKGRVGALALLGENATAKTTILEAIALTLGGAEMAQNLRPDGREYLRVSLDSHEPQPSEIRIFFSGSNTPIRLSIDRSGRFSGEHRPSMLAMGFSPQRYFIDGRDIRRPRGPVHVVSLLKTKQQMAAPNIWLNRCSPDRFDASVRALRPLLMLPPDGKVGRDITAKNGGSLTFEFHDRIESLDRFSEGYRSVLAMAVDIITIMLKYWRDLETARGVVLIDEVETHLHPRWKKRLVSGLREAMPFVQFIVTTHDPLCLRGFRDGEVVVLRRDNNRIEQVPNLPNVQGLSVEQLLTSDFFGLASAEDSGTEMLFNRFVTLASNPERNADEDAELRLQRTEIRQTLQLGDNPFSRIFYEALDEYMIERTRVSPKDRPKLDRKTVESLVNQWHRLDGEQQ